MTESLENRLKYLRRKSGMSQAEAAEAIRVNKKQVSAYEIGSRQPSLEILAELADFYHVTTDYLLGREENNNIDVSGLTPEDVALAAGIVTRLRENGSDENNRPEKKETAMKETNTCRLYSSVKQEKIEWLWYPYIPYGKLTLLQGDPGDGKSTCMIQIAACLSSGGMLPDGTKIDQPQPVIYQCAEDNLNDTVKPRLVSAGADCDRIAFISDDEISLSLNDRRIEEAISTIHARLLILDPIQAFISQSTDMQNAAQMRAVMSRLGNIARKYHCAVVLIGHMTKSAGGKHLYRGLGSIDIAAIARSVLMITRDKNMPAVRYLSQIKNSLAPEGESFSFIIDAETGFQWLGKCNCDAVKEAEEGESEKTTKLDQAKEQLNLMLEKEDIPSRDVIEKLGVLSISERTVRSAVQEMGIKAYRRDNRWYWCLPEKMKKEAAAGE